MNKIITKFIIFFFVIAGLCETAAACPCPPCLPCHHLISGYPSCNCKSDCDSGSECCNGGCCYSNRCESCIGGICKFCGGATNKFCCNGNCCTNGNCCENGSCTSTCYTFNEVEAYSEECPDCSGFFAACEGMIQVRLGYWEWRDVGSGEGGWCKNPTKTEIVGHLYECTEDWDVSKIIACASAGTVCGAGCAANIPLCVTCLIGVGAECLSEGLCSLVESCGPGDQLSDVERTVIDWEKDFGGFCYK